MIRFILGLVAGFVAGLVVAQRQIEKHSDSYAEYDWKHHGRI